MNTKREQDLYSAVVEFIQERVIVTGSLDDFIPHRDLFTAWQQFVVLSSLSAAEGRFMPRQMFGWTFGIVSKMLCHGDVLRVRRYYQHRQIGGWTGVKLLSLSETVP